MPSPSPASCSWKALIKQPKGIHTGATSPRFANDHAAEQEAIDGHNAAFSGRDARDNGTKELLDSILVEEEDHIDLSRSK